MSHCVKHPFEPAEAGCAECGDDFCAECLVYISPDRPPCCVPCALVLAGVRHRPRRKAMTPSAVVGPATTIRDEVASAVDDRHEPQPVEVAEEQADRPRRGRRPNLVGVLAVAAGSALIVVPSVLHLR